jgi:hypothetical protein
MICFTIPSKSFVTLRVFDILGKEVATLASQELSSGKYARIWDASRMPTGVYACRLQASGHVDLKRLLLLR